MAITVNRSAFLWNCRNKHGSLLISNIIRNTLRFMWKCRWNICLRKNVRISSSRMSAFDLCRFHFWEIISGWVSGTLVQWVNFLWKVPTAPLHRHIKPREPNCRHLAETGADAARDSGFARLCLSLAGQTAFVICCLRRKDTQSPGKLSSGMRT